MRQSRYRQPKMKRSSDEQMPLDTLCTILVRQSTNAQGERNLHSSEKNPDELVAEAHSMGFQRVVVLDDDTGIGAFSTTIEDRPALHRWLREMLPSGESKVVMVSQEDRLFRDSDEIQHNRFIKEVAHHGGWVICGRRVYDFRNERDCDAFREECRYGKRYILHHLKGRLHPAAQRAAMSGKYTGGAVPYGFIVDYNERSSTYKHLQLYEPHVPLVVDHVFKYFANLPTPSMMEVARYWDREGLVWPFYGPEIDLRIVRAADAIRRRDEARGGYIMGYEQVHHILTDVSYLGWRVRGGEIAMDGNQPRICHPALIDADLFWWCYDRLFAERPPWAPPRTTPVRAAPVVRRPISTATGEVRFIAHGRVKCAVHDKNFAVTQRDQHIVLQCCGNLHFGTSRAPAGCTNVQIEPIESALVHAITEQLAFSERDVSELARMAERRFHRHDEREQRIRQRIDDHQRMLKRAMDMAIREENAMIADELLTQARDAKRAIAESERDLASIEHEHTPSAQGWEFAQNAAKLASRVRATFGDWSRQAQSRLMTLAVDQAMLGYVDRYHLGMLIRWNGGRESREIITPKLGKHFLWTEDEKQLVRQWYQLLSWDALLMMFPMHSQGSIKQCALSMGLMRPRGVKLSDEVPAIAPDRTVTNTMELYGFIVAQGEIVRNPVSARASKTSRMSSPSNFRWYAMPVAS